MAAAMAATPAAANNNIVICATNRREDLDPALLSRFDLIIPFDLPGARAREAVFEMYAKQIYQSDLWGFLEVEEFVFGERTQVVVDPSEEKLKAQFEGVVRSFVPMHSIVRIDEVERLGTPKISEARGAVGNVMPFPMPMPEK